MPKLLPAVAVSAGAYRRSRHERFARARIIVAALLAGLLVILAAAPAESRPAAGRRQEPIELTARYAALSLSRRDAVCFSGWSSRLYGPGLGRGSPYGNARRRIVRCTIPSCVASEPELYGRP